MKAEWSKRVLGELCDFKNGLWKGKKGPFVRAGVIRNTNFTKNGRLDDTDIAYIDVEEKQFRSRQLEHGDLILEKSGGGPKQPVGRVVLFEKEEGDFSFSNFTSYVRVRDKGVLSPRFLHRYLHFLYLSGATETMQKNSTNIRNLQLSDYKRISVPLPPISEQKRIVVILDDVLAGIDTAIANAEQNLANSREIFEGKLNAAFDTAHNKWRRYQLGEVCKLQNGRAYKKSELLLEGKYPVLRVGNFFTNRKWYYSNLELPDQKYCDTGDLLYAWSASFGPRLWSGGKAIFHYHIWRVDFDRELIDRDFLYYWLRWDAERIQQEMGAGTTMVHVSMKSMTARYIHVPSLDEQREIVDQLDQLAAERDRLISVYAQKLEALSELRESLMLRAFSGDLSDRSGQCERNFSG